MNLLSLSYEPTPDPQCLEIQKRFLDFLTEFSIDGEPVYRKQAEYMKLNQTNTMYIRKNDLSTYRSNLDLYEMIQNGFFKFEDYLRKALHQFMFRLDPDIKEDEVFYLAFYGLPLETIRTLKTERLGKLMAISGTVTRSSEVRPELLQGSFICQLCNRLISHVPQQFKYTEPKFCKNPACHNTNKWQIEMESSVFCDFQKLRVQENSNEIPAGGMPRSIDIILRNEIVDKVKPGENAIFTGMLTVLPDIYSLLKPGEKTEVNQKNETIRKKNQPSIEGVSGLKALGVRDLSYKLIFIANNATSMQENTNYSMNAPEEEDEKEEEKRIMSQFTKENLEEIQEMSHLPDLYHRLSRSIAPTVTGHASEEIKKGVLLMLFGGVNKKTRENTSLRGDINICIVGDPATAKSQFLKFVSTFMPRSIYTSGKATSAAGLTASVLRDPDSGEFCIEAGALMLADNGVCCIDEFDKMDSKDQVAIHEAMEQQTISLAKAGIHATLNARASILAAANPIFGRYDKSKSLKFNLDISAPIMSRFDLFFVVLDECNEFMDHTIASHIVNLHRQREKAIEPDFSINQLRRYIKFAKFFKPQMTREAAETLRQEYIKLRINDAASQKTSYRITVRQLESLIRLSEALARVHLAETISPAYVKEAGRLLSNSILKVEKPQLDIEEQFEPAQEEHVLEGDRGGENVIQEELKQRKDEEVKKQTIKLTYEEYEKMAQSIIYYVQERRKESPEIEEKGVLQNEIANWYVEENFAQIASVDDATKLLKICHTVIQRLIAQEKILIVVEQNEDYKLRMVKLHSNYAGDIL